MGNKTPKKVFVLMSDGSGTTFSRPTPEGIAVTKEADAKEWVKSASVGYARAYVEVEIFDDLAEAIKHMKW